MHCILLVSIPNGFISTNSLRTDHYRIKTEKNKTLCACLAVSTDGDGQVASSSWRCGLCVQSVGEPEKQRRNRDGRGEREARGVPTCRSGAAVVSPRVRARNSRRRTLEALGMKPSPY